jgi:phenylalanyl-tRNA synthetase beta chain
LYFDRYDLLCAEGLGRALKIFTGSLSPVAYKTSQAVETLFVEKSTAQIRPICVAAVLRNVHFTEESYESFIYLQEKLHQNVCR